MIASPTAPADLVRQNREMRAVIEDALDDLDHYSTCCFDLCPGPDKPFVHMATCLVCAVTIGLRGVLAGEVVLDTARERLERQDDSSEAGAAVPRDSDRDDTAVRATPADLDTETSGPAFPITRILDVSTGHLRFETNEQLGDYEGLSADPTARGWLVSVPQEQLEQAAAEHDWPDELLLLFRHAIKHGCTCIKFEADGERCNEFPY
ncbi:hypothetical protein NQK81_01555 [Amycolatopsis roodepoortensis]|uniref:DUF5983 family protein n=1 Tax=Amycolatopsis roodepoortensis TaxID=700274 RepID=UPI00214CA5CE|nr:hypothetical protein [Amycolatopsis roodepoortensis]UUV32162.1 hypothetical protein NQK81_01555 [Amycolatopsis roodepoortensis]